MINFLSSMWNVTVIFYIKDKTSVLLQWLSMSYVEKMAYSAFLLFSLSKKPLPPIFSIFISIKMHGLFCYFLPVQKGIQITGATSNNSWIQTLTQFVIIVQCCACSLTLLSRKSSVDYPIMQVCNQAN